MGFQNCSTGNNVWDFEKVSEVPELGIYKNIKALKYGIPKF